MEESGTKAWAKWDIKNPGAERKNAQFEHVFALVDLSFWMAIKI